LGDYRSSPAAFFWLNQISDAALLSHLPQETTNQLFSGSSPTPADRVTAGHASRLWQRMKAGEFPLTNAPRENRNQHSDAIVAIDQWGNVAALVHTCNADTWGATGIFVGGVSIPDSAAFQQQAIHRAKPGNRLPDPMEPLVVLKDGQPTYALASIGAGLHQRTLVTLVNLLDAREGLEQAISAPAPHLPHYGLLGGKTVQVSEGDFESRLLEQAQGLGLKIKVLAGEANRAAPRGYIVGAMIDRQSGVRRAVGTKTFNAPPLGY
jgi:gamma-glutamyltranspeptidase/glutathione hydrolase